MSRHFYAFWHSYGIGTVWASTRKPIGYLKRFDSAAARDAWVAAESYTDGVAHREAVGYDFACAMLRFWFSYANDAAVDAVLGRGASTEAGFWKQHATIGQLWDICNERGL